ncbi:alpha/beta hydrolase [Nocardia sp. NPDC057353]|uniref:alpha/beta hydrolase n=1 Tax=Nocardia sp. NPDC057353 TaxID=3346104 RepID=UPI00363C9ABB
MAALVAMLAATVLTSCGADDSAPDLVAQADAAPTPELRWSPCTEPALAAYQCATARVPLDYADPAGRTIDLAVLRQPARTPETRIGTLFTAVGGPGGSGLDAAANGFPDELADRFDIVTFDQRGIGRSAPVRCFPGPAEQDAFWSDMPVPPLTAEQHALLARKGAEYAAGCAAHSGDLLAHLTTVDAARDMELLRRAVGDDRLSYTGGSYASYLGAVYGALFGDRVRAMQLGALIEPATYSADPLRALRETAQGTDAVRAEFHRYCAAAGPQRCALAAPGATAEQVAARDEAVLARLRSGPITVDTAAISYPEILPVHATLLYDVPQGWPALAELLVQLERGRDGDLAAVREIIAAGEIGFDFLAPFTAITCADAAFPRDDTDWDTWHADVERGSPTYGPFWLALRRPCAAWPTPAENHRMPESWTLRSATPALLLSNRFDPVTPIGFARRAATELGNAHLVEVDGHGHSPINACTRPLRAAYLIDLELPAAGTVCGPDQAPFPG